MMMGEVVGEAQDAKLAVPGELWEQAQFKPQPQTQYKPGGWTMEQPAVTCSAVTCSTAQGSGGYLR